MIGLLTLDAYTGSWATEIYATAGERKSDLPSDERLAREIADAVEFQASRGGGVFVLNLSR